VWYEWCVLLFGIVSAFWVFTKRKRLLVKMWRVRRIKLISYMNGFLFAAKSRKKAIRLQIEVLEDLAALK
jgi:hypothetical protein